MKTFKEFEHIEGFRGCVKKQIVVGAQQINELFAVETRGGLVMAPRGDYLMRGADGELYPCDKATFKKTYNFIEALNGRVIPKTWW